MVLSGFHLYTRWGIMSKCLLEKEHKGSAAREKASRSNDQEDPVFAGIAPDHKTVFLIAQKTTAIFRQHSLYKVKGKPMIEVVIFGGKLAWIVRLRT